MIKVVRESALTPKQLTALGALIRGEVYTQQSDWVCQARQQPGWWDDASLAATVSNAASKAVLVWIGLVDDVPMGLCWVCEGDPDRDVAMFLISSTLAPKDSLALADAITIAACQDGVDKGKRDIVGVFPENTPAAAYALRGGFKSEAITSPTAVLPTTKPIVRWRIGIKELLDNITRLQAAGK